MCLYNYTRKIENENNSFFDFFSFSLIARITDMLYNYRRRKKRTIKKWDLFPYYSEDLN